MSRSAKHCAREKFWICDRRDNCPITSFATWKETIASMERFVRDDREAGLYRPHFYEAVEYSPEKGIIRRRVSP